MRGIITIIIGLLLIVFDVNVPVANYPTYVKSNKISFVIQDYIGNNYFGHKFTFDILPDILGLVVLFAGSVMLVKYSKKVYLAMVFMIVAIILAVMVPVLPFMMTGKELCVTTLFTVPLEFICEVMAQYFVLAGITKATLSKKTAHGNNLMMLGWYGTLFCNICILFSRFYGLNYIRYAYTAAALGTSILFLVMIYQLRNDIGKAEPVEEKLDINYER